MTARMAATAVALISRIAIAADGRLDLTLDLSQSEAPPQAVVEALELARMRARVGWTPPDRWLPRVADEVRFGPGYDATHLRLPEKGEEAGGPGVSFGLDSGIHFIRSGPP
jgi:hypothetical protein